MNDEETVLYFDEDKKNSGLLEEDEIMKTAEGLVAYCKAQLGKPYWWGTFGQIASAGLLAAKRQQYPMSYGWNDFEQQFGQKVHDCCGLIKGYRWCETPDSKPRYVGSQDVAVAGLYNQCDKKGDIGSMPDVPGTCVFRQDLGHVGVYIGGGMTIEAQGHATGVVKKPLGNRWAFWGQPAWIDYDEAAPVEPEYPVPTYFYTLKLPLLKPGMKHPTVSKVQRYFRIPETGIMDGPTVEVVKDFQRRCGLLADGEIGGDTYAALLGLRG